MSSKDKSFTQTPRVSGVKTGNNNKRRKKNRRSKKNNNKNVVVIYKNRGRRRFRNVNNLINRTSVRFKRTELWQSDVFTESSNFTVKNYVWNAANATPWFKAITKMYEKIKYNGISFKILFTGSSMTKGAYYISYNTNEADYATLPNDSKTMLAQKGSKIVRASANGVTMKIDKTGLTGFSTTLPTTTEGSYLCNVMVGGTCPEDVDFCILVTYDITLFTPQSVD